MVITANPPKFDKRQPSKGGYDAIVYIDGSQVIAEDSNGRKIASGVAGTDDSTVIQSAITSTISASSTVSHPVFVCNGRYKLQTGLVFPNPTVISDLYLPTQYRIIGGAGIIGESTKGCVFDVSDMTPGYVFDVNDSPSSIYYRYDSPVFGNFSLFELGTDHLRGGISISSAQQVSIFDIVCRNLSTSLKLYNIWEGTIRGFCSGLCGNVSTSSPAIDIIGGSDVSSSSNHLTFDRMYGGVGYYTWFRTSGKVLYSHMSNISPEFDISPGIVFGPDSDFTLSNISLYGGKPAIDIAGASKILINQLRIITTNATDYPIKMSSAADVNIHNSIFSGGPSVAYVSADASSLNMIGAKFLSGTCGGVLLVNDCTSVILDDLYFSNLAYYTIRIDGVNAINSNVTIDNAHAYNVAAVSGYPIEIATSNNVNLRNICMHKAAANTYAIGFSGGCYGIHVSDDILLDGSWSGVYNIVSGGLTLKEWSNGSSTGTGSEQAIAHRLDAIPVGCKAWITYKDAGGDYITEFVRFNGTSIKVNLDTGIAYTWGIGAI